MVYIKAKLITNQDDIDDILEHHPNHWIKDALDSYTIDDLSNCYVLLSDATFEYDTVEALHINKHLGTVDMVTYISGAVYIIEDTPAYTDTVGHVALGITDKQFEYGEV